MNLVINAAYLVAIVASVGLFLFSYFEALQIINQDGRVKGGSMIAGFSFALFFALMAYTLS